jgi:hypothetical protein
MHRPIYSIGDSHSGTLCPWANQIRLGAETIHTFATGKCDNHFKYFQETGVLKKDGLWIFTLGEIDIRCHVYNQIHKKGRKEHEVILDLVERYTDKIMSLNTDVAIMSVVPPIQYDERKEEVDKDPAFAIYSIMGPDKDRSRYTFFLNHGIWMRCILLGIPYLNIYDRYKDEKGMLPIDMSDGNVHILNRGKVETYLKELDLIP